MGTHPVSEDRLREIVAVCASCKTRGEASGKLGIGESVIRYHLRNAAARGLTGFKPVLDGFEIARVSTAENPDGQITKTYVTQKPERGPEFEPPPGFVLKAVTADVGPDGRVNRQWPRYAPESDDIANRIEAIKTVFDQYKGYHELPPSPAHVNSDLVTVYVAGDHHLGLFSWKRETGENYDLKIGEKILLDAMGALVANAPASETAIVLSLGDFFHSDTSENRTAHSGNSLDVDTRYSKVLQVGIKLMVACIELALQKHGKVIVRCIPGNHDPHTSLALSAALSAFFHTNPRVDVDCDPSKFFYWKFGRVFLAATHGDQAKPDQMPGIMAATQGERWGTTTFRYCYMGHVHHKNLIGGERFGVVVESFQTLAAKDAWHAGMGYNSGRSMVAITHHRDHGEVFRHTVSVNPKTGKIHNEEMQH